MLPRIAQEVPQSLILYVAAEQKGDAHAEFLQNPGSARAPRALPFSQRSGILFLLIDSVVLAVCVRTHYLAGGVCNHIPIVFPAHQWRRIGRDFHLVADENGLVLFQPEYFSKAGYAARLAAHRVAVLQAVKAGRDVDPENLNAIAPICETVLPEPQVQRLGDME